MITAEERFWSFVVKTESCWNWIGAGAGSSRGYGRFSIRIDGKSRLLQAHRFSYELLVGPIPTGLEIDHLCRNRRCVNPAHLESVTAQINQHRSASVSGLNAAKTHCPRGHAYADVGRLDPNGGKRYCRECCRLNTAAYRKRLSAISPPDPKFHNLGKLSLANRDRHGNGQFI
jgi:hypothetical protein